MGGGFAGGAMAPTFLKSYFVKDVFQEIRFGVILQGIQNVFDPGTSRISFGFLEIWIFISRLLHSIIIAGKKESLKKLSDLKLRILLLWELLLA